MSWSLTRRSLLQTSTLAGAAWLTPVAHWLARAEEEQKTGRHAAYSVILLWMQGGPSQLETFDPHPGKSIAGGTEAIDTAVPGIQLAKGMERVAEQMGSIALVRNIVTKEGDHERGSYLVKTGYTPLPATVHPSIGALICHELPTDSTEIPRHVSIAAGPFVGRGGFLGDQYDAFKLFDPQGPLEDVKDRVPDERALQRVKDLEVVERNFARGRAVRAAATLHRETIENARRMMTSDQLKAFDISDESRELRDAYGDSPFGRGCLAARRLVQRGVRCVEVSLGGWDTHTNNHEQHKPLVERLDMGYSTLLKDLQEQGLSDRTVVIVAGEFGRTPTVNPLGGRDHWPSGFSIALSGGGIKGGQVLGATDPEGNRLTPEQGRRVSDIHATVLTALGLDPTKENIAPGPRPIRLSEGDAIPELLQT